MNTLFIILQRLLPQHLLSRMVGFLAELRRPLWLKNALIDTFIRQFDVDMTEAVKGSARDYDNFNAFFTRALHDDARPISDADIVHPADGAISQIGDIEHGLLFQAKGHYYHLFHLLGGDKEAAKRYDNGHFATVYLSPRDYHRLHMPIAGTLVATTYVPGDLFSVNQVTAENVEGLFARNERLICHFDTEAGPMAMILVGAMIVAGIETVWGGQIAPPPKQPQTLQYTRLPEPVKLAKGEEMGRFKLGSTVILLFGEDRIRWHENGVAGASTRLGEPMATLRTDED